MSNSVRASRRKYHIIYKTTCLTTGRYYIGMHSTDNLDDGYLGSGVRLNRSVKKYGKQQHTREILEILPTRQAASDREKELITEELRADPMCLNCGVGGLGAVDRPPTKEETLAKRSASMKEAWDSGRMTGMRGKKHDPEVVAKQVAKRVGKKRTEEQKANLSNGLRQHYADEVNRIAHKERMSKEEVSAKKRASMLARFAVETPEERAARFAKMKECSNRPEVKAKKSASMKAKNPK